MIATLAAQDPVKPLPPPASQELPPGIRWSVQLPASPASPPVIAGDRVFVSILPGAVEARRLADGQPLWRETLNPEQPLAVDGERVIVAAGEAVHAVNVADGAMAWRVATGKLAAPLLAKDGWVIAASASKLFAIRASDGGVIWSCDSAPPRQRPAISGDALFVPLASGRIVAHDLTSGAIRWTRPLGGVPAEPLVVGDRLYVGATNKRFYSIDTDTGEIEWPWTVGAEIRGAAASDGERIFYAALDNVVRAVNRTDGAQRWQQGIAFRPFEGPRVMGPNVVVAGPTPDVVLLGVRDGRPAGKLTFPEALVFAPAYGTYENAIVVAGVSGGLTEAWKLWLASPAAAK